MPTAARESSQPVGAAAPHREPSLLLGGGLGGWGEGVSLREEGTDAYIWLGPGVAQQKRTL